MHQGIKQEHGDIPDAFDDDFWGDFGGVESNLPTLATTPLFNIYTAPCPCTLPGVCHTADKSQTICELGTIERSMRKQFTLDNFYQKSTTAWSLPVVSSSHVSDEALTRACQIIHFMLSDRADVRDRLLKFGKKFAVLGKDETITAMPEYKRLNIK